MSAMSKKTEARDRVKSMREEQARKERRREQMMRFGIIAAVLVAVAIIAVAVMANRSSGPVDPDVQPAGITESGGGYSITEAAADAPTMEVWFDFSCPHCRDFEAASGPFLKQLADNGDANVVYRPVTFVGQLASIKATNAWACSLDEGMGEQYMDAIYAIQGNYTDSQLLSAAESVGLSSDTFESCVEDGTYEGWVNASHSLGVNEFSVNSTPTIFVVNGDQRTVVDSSQWNPAGLQAALGSGTGEETEPVEPPATDSAAAEAEADE
ncbi:MAG TPA: thioredoxin domain-containing protein [Jiangellaceae bacterium]